MSKSLLRAAVLVSTIALIPATTATMAAVDVNTYKELDQFMNVLRTVRADYVDQVDDKKLIEGAINGMLESLDPHSNYLDVRDFQNLKTQTDGSYGGLGLTVQMEDGAVKVVTPTEDTPAYRAGIKSGDYITNLDGTLIYGGSLDEAVDKMRGSPGTKIKLTIVRPGRDKPFDVTLTREIIQIKPVKWSVNGRVGIININSFSKSTGAGVRDGIAAIDKQLGGRPLGYVVDLRSNPGGLLDQAIEVSDAFLTHGEIVSQRGREKTDIDRYYATRKAADFAHGLPIVVLVDSGTASAAEIVAGALQDQRRGLIIGERSFGKGSVQTLVPLTDDTALRLTTARYYTPSGRSVQEGGIQPDILVPQLSDTDYKDRPRLREADLRRHLINQAKVDDSLLEDDAKPDPRFTQTAAGLEKAGVKDFQLDYAIKTIARLGPPSAANEDGRGPVTRFAAARALALALPAALLGGALAFQYIGGLVPCEMCHWQRWPHGAAIVVALAAFALPPRPARAAVVLAALLAMVSGGIGVYHWGVEQHIFDGLTQCSSSGSGGDPAKALEDIFASPLVRCDQPQWSMFGISMAGWNAILSLGLGLVILWLTLKPVRR